MSADQIPGLIIGGGTIVGSGIALIKMALKFQRDAVSDKTQFQKDFVDRYSLEVRNLAARVETSEERATKAEARAANAERRAEAAHMETLRCEQHRVEDREKIDSQAVKIQDLTYKVEKLQQRG